MQVSLEHFLRCYLLLCLAPFWRVQATVTYSSRPFSGRLAKLTIQSNKCRDRRLVTGQTLRCEMPLSDLSLTRASPRLTSDPACSIFQAAIDSRALHHNYKNSSLFGLLQLMDLYV